MLSTFLSLAKTLSPPPLTLRGSFDLVIGAGVHRGQTACPVEVHQPSGAASILLRG